MVTREVVVDVRSALSQAIAVRRGAVSPVALTEAALARIAEVNPEIHAFVQVFAARALAEAKAQERRRKDDRLPVFFGVPTGIKDTAPTRGGRTQAGTRALKWLYTPLDGAIARAVRAGGFVVLGKTATSELAILPVVETDLHPPCRNPYDPEHLAGGSSGGAAAAVAAGITPIAHAEDGGGSIRIPASFCGLFGHKPARGTVPHFHAAVDPLGMGLVNCVAHDVEDSAAMLDVLSGRAYDPSAPPPESLLARCRVAPRGLKIRVMATSSFAAVDPEIGAAVWGLAHLLESLGHHVDEGAPLDLSVDEVLPAFVRMPAQVPVIWEGLLQPATRWVRAAGRRVSAEAVLQLGRATTEKMLGWFGDADLWVTPTCPVLPPRVGAWKDLDGEGTFRAAMPLGTFTAPFNVSGQPAASVPWGLSASGLPIGVQLVGRPGDDAAVLAVARQIGEARPWRDRRPIHRALSG